MHVCIVDFARTSVRWEIFIISMKDQFGEINVHIVWRAFADVRRKQLNMEERQDKRKIIEETVKNDIYDTCFVKDLEESYQFLTPDEKQICWNCFHLYTAMKYIFLLVSRCYDTSQTQNDRSGYGYQSRTISAATSHSASTINDLVYVYTLC